MPCTPEGYYTALRPLTGRPTKTPGVVCLTPPRACTADDPRQERAIGACTAEAIAPRQLHEAAAADDPTFTALTSGDATLTRQPAAMSGCSEWRSPQMSVNESMRFYHEKSTMSLAASLTDCSCPPCGEIPELETPLSHNGYWSFMTAPGHFCAPDPTLAERGPRCRSETSFTDLARHSLHEP